MGHQELLCVQKSRLLHKDWSMRLEALANGLPVDISKLTDIVNDTFIQDIQVLCDDVESCPCFPSLKRKHAEVHRLVQQWIEHPKAKQSPALEDMISGLNAMLDSFDALEDWLESRGKVILQLKAKKKPAQADSVMDTLEKSTQEIEDLLKNKS